MRMERILSCRRCISKQLRQGRWLTIQRQLDCPTRQCFFQFSPYAALGSSALSRPKIYIESSCGLLLSTVSCLCRCKNSTPFLITISHCFCCYMYRAPRINSEQAKRQMGVYRGHRWLWLGQQRLLIPIRVQCEVPKLSIMC